MTQIHQTAIVHPEAVLGEGVKIWHFCHIMAGAKIGARSSLGQNVVVGPGVKIGTGCKLQNNVSLPSGVTLDDEVFCGPSCVFTNIATPRAFVDRKAEFACIHVRRGATVGANSTLVCRSLDDSLIIGSYALVAAGAVVTRDVLDYALVKGVPAYHTGWVSRVGEVLSDDLVCPRTGESYRLRDNRLTQAK